MRQRPNKSFRHAALDGLAVELPYPGYSAHCSKPPDLENNTIPHSLQREAR
jgi:hypothetical protein